MGQPESGPRYHKTRDSWGARNVAHTSDGSRRAEFAKTVILPAVPIREHRFRGDLCVSHGKQTAGFQYSQPQNLVASECGAGTKHEMRRACHRLVKHRQPRGGNTWPSAPLQGTGLQGERKMSPWDHQVNALQPIRLNNSNR